MGKLIDFLRRLGVVEGLTFRTVHEDGVGVFIEPNPSPNRMQPQSVDAHRKAETWCARRVFLTDRFPFLQ